MLPPACAEHIDELFVGAGYAGLLRHALCIAGVVRLNGGAIAKVKLKVLKPFLHRDGVCILEILGVVEQRNRSRTACAGEDVHGDLVDIQCQNDSPAEVRVVVRSALTLREHQALCARVVHGCIRELVVPCVDLVVRALHCLQLFHRNFAEDINFVADHLHLSGGGVAKITEPNIFCRNLIFAVVVVLCAYNAKRTFFPVVTELVEDPVAVGVIVFYGVRACYNRLLVLIGRNVSLLGVNVLRNDAVIGAPYGDAVTLCKAREGFLHRELNGVIVNLLNLIDVEVGRCGSTDLIVFFDHVEREDNVVSVQVFTVGPLDAFADLNGPFGKVFVRGAHIGCNFRELLTGNGVHFPKVCAHQLMNTEAHVRTGHVAVELARSVGRRRSLNNQSFVTVRANRRNLTCGGIRAGAGRFGSRRLTRGAAGAVGGAGGCCTACAAAATAAAQDAGDEHGRRQKNS